MRRGASGPRKVPLAVKAAYTLFLCVLVPFYWTTYGPQNFLWFCDIALVVTLAALWLESPFLASTQALSITLLQVPWIADFTGGLFLGRTFGVATYMFNAEIPLFVRALSLFHGWLPVLLVWLVWRLGYDRRALAAQTLLGWAVLLACYAFDVRDAKGVSINWVIGLEGKQQAWMPPGAYLALLMVFLPACIYLPTDLLFRRLTPRPGHAHASPDLQA